MSLGHELGPSIRNVRGPLLRIPARQIRDEQERACTRTDGGEHRLWERDDDDLVRPPQNETPENTLDLRSWPRVAFAEIMIPDINRVVRQLPAAGVSIAQLQIRARKPEALFLELTGQALRA